MSGRVVIQKTNSLHRLFSSRPKWLQESLRADVSSVDVNETLKRGYICMEVGLYRETRTAVKPGTVLTKGHDGRVNVVG